APALAAADVGIALGCGAELSRDAAGVCLLADDLRRAPWSIALARRTIATIRQNLFWAFAYNSAGVALAASGRLNPVWAALAMAASSLIVIGNSLRLARFPEPGESVAELNRAAEDAAQRSPQGVRFESSGGDIAQHSGQNPPSANATAGVVTGDDVAAVSEARES
ncbi:MAG: cation-translocating P-type ATPase, partial [Planctomycetales bacterium]|nr:cation-translocating P-type ATPase [Planctomycetales bacterium]